MTSLLSLIRRLGAASEPASSGRPVESAEWQSVLAQWRDVFELDRRLSQFARSDTALR